VHPSETPLLERFCQRQVEGALEVEGFAVDFRSFPPLDRKPTLLPPSVISLLERCRPRQVDWAAEEGFTVQLPLRSFTPRPRAHTLIKHFFNPYLALIVPFSLSILVFRWSGLWRRRASGPASDFRYARCLNDLRRPSSLLPVPSLMRASPLTPGPHLPSLRADHNLPSAVCILSNHFSCLRPASCRHHL